MGLVEQHHALNPPERPVCSVCIANYNGAALLDDCLASVLSQQGDISIEIIVHDDSSIDDSVALLRANYPQVEVLASRENVGFCIGNNRMVAHARGEFVLLLNNDAALCPDALLTLIEAARVQSSAGILTLPQYDWETGVLVDRGCLLDPFYNPVPNLDPDRSDVAMVIGACLFLPRALWSDLGGFPEWMGSIAEDMYLCCLARLRGLSIRVTSDSGYRHRQGSSFGGGRVDAGRLQTTFHRRRLSERNKTAVMLICTPSLLVWPLLVTHVIELAVEGAALTLLRWDAQIWQQIYAPTFAYIAGELGSLRRRRKQVQLASRTSLREYMRCMVLFSRKLSMLLRYGVPTLK
ncbi:glycosyl transferase [Rhodanobacter sp. B04]|uniref:glycosyltransferase family 2 protein n=1 Tax=Rhodanobacter sp. B04 TaxID=1945860 RepID=UPI00098488E9|nr:glycosyltransferase [Rhodanobacter sp. B04]OOG64084.1 glycosyl transferase [Rhodanobacter sp. B04]